MYETPVGERILLGAERRLFVHALATLIDLLTDDDVPMGVAVFDALQRNQKLVTLYRAARALLNPLAPCPQLTASIEAAVAAVFEMVKERVAFEIEHSTGTRDKADAFWRTMAIQAAVEQVMLANLPNERDTDLESWHFVIECLAGRILWDFDYECQSHLDLPPEKGKAYRRRLGLAEQYFADIPPDPHDEEVVVYLDALQFLTAEAR